MLRVAVSPETVTVLGYNVKEDDPMWRGLDFDKAEPRQQASIMVAMVGQDAAPSDIHLNVPFCEPEGGDPEDDLRYRVRPKMTVGKKYKGHVVKSVAFERWDGRWFIAIETEN